MFGDNFSHFRMGGRLVFCVVESLDDLGRSQPAAAFVDFQEPGDQEPQRTTGLVVLLGVFERFQRIGQPGPNNRTPGDLVPLVERSKPRSFLMWAFDDVVTAESPLESAEQVG